MLMVMFLVFAAISLWLGNDSTPDFRIYHFYNGFAALHGRALQDIVPAQLQTANFYGLDAITYAVTGLLNHHPPFICIILSLPYFLASIAVYVMARIFLGVPGPVAALVALATTLFGLCGAGNLPTLATVMSDVPPSVPMLAGMALWYWKESSGTNTTASLLLAGALCGLSVGLKLTVVPVFIGLFCALAIHSSLARRPFWRDAVLFGAVGLLAFLVIDGAWLVHNIRAYGNPIFPNMNNLFKSDLVSHTSWADTRFLPKTLLQALAYPAFWAFHTSSLTIEIEMRDARILLGCLCALLVMAGFAWRAWRANAAAPSRMDHLCLHLAITYVVAYALWEYEWSIHRYLAIEEALSGVMLLAAMQVWLRPQGWRPGVVALALVMLPIAATTRYPWWGRVTTQAIDADLPPIEQDAMVVLLDPYGYSYLVPFLPKHARVIGADNNLVRPGAPGLLEGKIEAAIRAHAGPIWGMSFPHLFPGEAAAVMRFHHLHEVPGSCTDIRPNIEAGLPIHLCRLARDGS